MEEDHSKNVGEIDSKMESLDLEKELEITERFDEVIVIQKIEQEEKIESILDVDLPGHLNNLNSDQRGKLLEFWSLALGLLTSSFNGSTSSFEASTPKQNKELASTIKENNQSTSSLSSEDRMDFMRKHPLSDEFWFQLSTDHPDVILLRLLRARKWNVGDAFSMFYEGLKWRRRMQVRKILNQGEAGIKTDILTKGESYFWGLDKHKRLVIYLTAKLHNRNAQTLDEISKYNVYQIEVGRRLFQPGVETVLLVFDLKDAPFSSLDFGSMQFMIQCLQSFYPESLGRCLILNAPWIFWGFYKLLKPLLDPVVSEKIIFVDDMEHMKTFIDDKYLLETYGGNCRYKYSYLPPKADSSHSPSVSTASSNKSSTQSTAKLSTSSISSTPSSSLTDVLMPNGPVILSNEEMTQIYTQIEEKKRDFVDLTLVYLTKLCESPSKSSSSMQNNGEVGFHKAQRDSVIKELSELYLKLDQHFYPQHMYERLGIVKPDGVEWLLDDSLQESQD